MKYCSKCGNKLKEEDVFCSRCGAKTSVFGAYDKPGHEEKKTEIQTKMKKVLDPDAPGARYTAAVEKNAVAVTEYLKRASDLEWELYQTEEIGIQLKERERSWREEVEKENQAIATYEEKIAETERQIRNYSKKEYRRKAFDYKFKFDLLLFVEIFGGLLALFAIGGLASIPPFVWLFDGIVSISSPGGKVNFLIVLLILFGIPAIIDLVVQAIRYYMNKTEHEENEDEANIRYEEEQEQLEKEALESFNNDLNDYTNIVKMRQNEKARVENVVIKQVLEEIEKNTAEAEKVKDLMRKFYSTQVIFPKYRSLVPVNTMLSYFKAGRCSELTGHGGAYNMYEKDLQIKAIRTNLSEIAELGENASDSQKEMVSRLEIIGNQVKNIMATVDEVIAGNMSANPNGTELKKPLEYSRELKRYYGSLAGNLSDHMEYIQDINNHSRHWF